MPVDGRWWKRSVCSCVCSGSIERSSRRIVFPFTAAGGQVQVVGGDTGSCPADLSSSAFSRSTLQHCTCSSGTSRSYIGPRRVLLSFWACGRAVQRLLYQEVMFPVGRCRLCAVSRGLDSALLSLLCREIIHLVRRADIHTRHMSVCGHEIHAAISLSSL